MFLRSLERAKEHLKKLDEVIGKNYSDEVVTFGDFPGRLLSECEL